jgi:hypothetical protein
LTVEEMEKQLRDKRAQSAWYGTRGDHAMQRQLAEECYVLYRDIEYVRAARA